MFRHLIRPVMQGYPSPDFRLAGLAMLVTIVTASAAFCLLTGGSDLLVAGDGILGAGYAVLMG